MAHKIEADKFTSELKLAFSNSRFIENEDVAKVVHGNTIMLEQLVVKNGLSTEQLTRLTMDKEMMIQALESDYSPERVLEILNLINDALKSLI